MEILIYCGNILILLMAQPGTQLRINLMPSKPLQDYIASYANVLGIDEVNRNEGYITIATSMNSTQITQFKQDVLNHVLEIV